MAYAYDKSGNRTQAGTKTFTYDERNQLLSSSDGTTYRTRRAGTLDRHRVRVGRRWRPVTDAFGQVVSQAAPGGRGIRRTPTTGSAG